MHLMRAAASSNMTVEKGVLSVMQILCVLFEQLEAAFSYLAYFSMNAKGLFMLHGAYATISA